MHPARTVGVVALLVGVALAIVGLRGEQARTASRMMKLSGQRIALRRELWDMQMAVARLRAPDQVRDRVERLAGDGASDSGETTGLNRRQPSGWAPGWSTGQAGVPAHEAGPAATVR